MKQCWAEEPAERPSFDDVMKTLKVINKGKSASFAVYLFLPRDATRARWWHAKLSVCDAEAPWPYILEFFENNFTTD